MPSASPPSGRSSAAGCSASARKSASPALLKLLKGGSIAANPAQIHKLPLAVQQPLIDAFSHSLQTVFIVAVPFAVVAFVLCWFLKETPLRNTAFVAAQTRPGQAPGEGAVADGRLDGPSNGHVGEGASPGTNGHVPDDAVELPSL